MTGESGAIGMLRGKPFFVGAAVLLAAVLSVRLAMTAFFEGGLTTAQVLAGAEFMTLLYVISCASFYSFKFLKRAWPTKPLATPEENAKAALEEFIRRRD